MSAATFQLDIAAVKAGHQLAAVVESAGVKLKDADLLGLPVRAVVSPRSLKAGVVEIKRRSDADAIQAPLDEAVNTIRGMLDA